MNAPLARRGFLRALAAAPVAARTLATNLVAPTAAQLAGVAVGTPSGPPSPGSISMLTYDSKLHALYKAGLLPEWCKKVMLRELRWSPDGDKISPDIAALRSVSLSAKVLINQRRAEKRFWDRLDDELAIEFCRKNFYENGGPAL